MKNCQSKWTFGASKLIVNDVQANSVCCPSGTSQNIKICFIQKTIHRHLIRSISLPLRTRKSNEVMCQSKDIDSHIYTVHKLQNQSKTDRICDFRYCTRGREIGMEIIMQTALFHNLIFQLSLKIKRNNLIFRQYKNKGNLNTQFL